MEGDFAFSDSGSFTINILIYPSGAAKNFIILPQSLRYQSLILLNFIFTCAINYMPFIFFYLFL